MIKINNHGELERKDGKGDCFYPNHPKENQRCPFCDGILKSRSSVRRLLIISDDLTIIIMIRVLQCQNCHKHHRELPKEVIPYKRWSAENIEKVIDDKPDHYVGEISTCCRIKKWFKDLVAIGLAAALVAINNRLPEPIYPPLEKMREEPGWLEIVVRGMVNCGIWYIQRNGI
jgi:hypothetical protein